MVNNISYVSDTGSNAGMRLSLGEYSTTTKTLRFWVYHTRMEPVQDSVTHKVVDRVVRVRDVDSADYKEYLKLSDTIEFVDLDWDKRWSTSKKAFLKVKPVEGWRSFKLSELKEHR